MTNINSELSENIRLLIYGAAGVGKTHLLRDFPKPMHIFDFDQKLHPLHGVEGVSKTSYALEEATDAKSLFAKFWKDYKQIKSQDDIATIVIDSATSMSTILQFAKMMQSNKPPTAACTQAIYGDIKNWYKTFFHSLKSAHGKIVVMTAHEDYVIEDESKIHSIRPNLIGSIKTDVSSIFTDTLYLDLEVKAKEGAVRTLHFTKYKKHIASSVMFELEPLVNPTYATLLKHRRIYGK